MSTKVEKRKQNRFAKMVALKNLLEKNSDGIDLEPPEKKKSKITEFTDEQYKTVKRELDEKKSELKNKPKMRLKRIGELASMDSPADDNRQPIFLEDVYSLACNLYFGSSTIPHNPWRWCHMEKIAKVSHTVVVYVSGLSAYEFASFESRFAKVGKIFPIKLEVILPSSNGLERFLRLPLVELEKRQLIRAHGSLDVALKTHPLEELRPIYPVTTATTQTAEDDKLPEADEFSRTKLLLSALQMVDEGYPVPVSGDLAYRYDFRLTKQSYAPVTSSSPMFALDCEMCQTSLGINELTRVSVVNERLESVYETFVKPENKITNYMTAYSGITEEMLRDVTKTLQEVQEDIEKLLPADAILVGQSLNVDLHCMKLMHPYVIDTSVIFNIAGERKSKSKLKTLAREFLGETIQNHQRGHDSIEDSASCMKLVQLKLSKSLEYGDMVLINRARFNQTHEPKKGGSKTVCVAGAKTCSYDFDSFFRELTTHPDKVESLQIKSFIYEDNQAVLTSVAENALQYNFTICNVDVDGVQVESLAPKIDSIDNGLEQVFQNMAPNGCLMLVLGGSATNPKRGVVLCRVKE